MPTVNLNRKVFEKLVGKKLALAELKDRISMLGTDLEEVSDESIVVEVFPNRPDMLSEQGFARAFSSFIGAKPGLTRYSVKESGLKVVVDSSVSMRPYTACCLVKNIHFDDERVREIIQVQEKLATTHGRNRKKSAYGLYPSKAIKFPVYYTAKDPKEVMFQPLGFDKKIRADKVETEHPAGIKYAHIAHGWKKYPFFIDSANNVMCMLPYTNSEDTGKIDESTTELFIECTGNDFNNVMKALSIFTTTLADMGGEVYSIDVVYPDRTVKCPNLEPLKMSLDLEYVNKMLGLELSKKEVVDLLERMGYGFDGKVLVPAWRNDILHEVDIVEDIAIAYGYENFKEEIPNVSTVGEESGFERFKRKISQLMAGLGFLECNTYHLTNTKILNEKMRSDIENVSLANALTEDYSILRSWMIPVLMNVLSENTHNEYPQNIFEIGEVFVIDEKKETKVREDHRLAVLVCGKDADFTSVKQVADYLLFNIGLEHTSEDASHSSFIPGRVARMKVKGKKVAYVGELHPEVVSNFGLEMPVAALEINVSELWDILKE